jgi:hypothetical protein
MLGAHQSFSVSAFGKSPTLLTVPVTSQFTMSPTLQRRSPMRRATILFLLLVFWSTPAFADVWALHSPLWCRTFVELAVPERANYVDDSGVDFPQQSSPLTTILGTGGSFATGEATTRGFWGATGVDASGKGGATGSDNPFLAPITAQLGPGIADIDYDVTRNGSLFTISGTTEYNSNGFLELSVLDLSGMTLPEQQTLASDIFLTLGSVEKALDAGLISASQVLFREREIMLPTNGSFSRNVDVDLLANNDIVVSALGHTVSAAPEPSTWLMFGTGLIGLLGYGWRRKKSA